MAIKKLNKIGYGQLEPNKINAQYTKQVFAQLPLAEEVAICEQGMWLVYDQVAGKVTLPQKGKYACLVWNEFIKVDERLQADSDYAMMNKPENKYQAAIERCPRLLAPTKLDTFTTNMVKLEEDAMPAIGTAFIVDVDGYLVAKGETADTELEFAVIKITTMPDGQNAIKFGVTKVVNA